MKNLIQPLATDIVISAPVFDGRRVSGAYAVDAEKVHKNVDFTMTREWATRRDDERFHTFAELKKAAEHWERISYENPIKLGQIIVTDAMEIIVPTRGGEYKPLDPTHLAFSQLCEIPSPTVPASYLRALGASGEPHKVKRAAEILREALKDRGHDTPLSPYVAHEEGEHTLRSLVFNENTRITNGQILRWLEPIIGDLTASNPLRWKTPGMLDWSSEDDGSILHNPYNMEDQDSLFMGAEDMCLFFCQDANPIEIGKTRRGLPDVYFPGCILTTSEVKHAAIHLIFAMIRGVCCNLSLRGVEGKKSYQIRHTANGGARFMRTIESRVDESLHPGRFIAQIQAMKDHRIDAICGVRSASDREEATVKFISNQFYGADALSKSRALEIVKAGFAAEQHPIETVYDGFNAITEYAKGIRIQEKRRPYEFAAMGMLNAAA